MRERVVVGRLWHRPEITATVDVEGIGASISVEDFVKALAAEVGSPTFVMTKEQLLQKMLSGSLNIMQELKGSTKYVS